MQDATGQVIGRYRLQRKISAGGMGTVYLATLSGQAGFRRLVAIKRLHPHLTAEPDFLAMFIDEARIAAQLRHPCVVPVIDVVGHQGELLLVMDFVVGISLRNLLDRASQLGEPIPRAVLSRIFCDALEGLFAAHTACDENGQFLGLVHRDIAPENLLLGVDGTTKVADFGIAKANSKIHHTRTGVVLGRVSYMSPEQLTERPVDPRSDIYSAGVCLWEAISLTRAFGKLSDAEISVKVLNGRLPNLLLQHSWVGREMSDLVETATHPTASCRYASATEMAQAIESIWPPGPAREVGAYLRKVAGDLLQEVEAESRRLVKSTSSVPDGEAVPRKAEPEEGRDPKATLLASGERLGSPLDPSPRDPLRASPQSTILLGTERELEKESSAEAQAPSISSDQGALARAEAVPEPSTGGLKPHKKWGPLAWVSALVFALAVLALSFLWSGQGAPAREATQGSEKAPAQATEETPAQKSEALPAAVAQPEKALGSQPSSAPVEAAKPSPKAIHPAPPPAKKPGPKLAPRPETSPAPKQEPVDDLLGQH